MSLNALLNRKYVSQSLLLERNWSQFLAHSGIWRRNVFGVIQGFLEKFLAFSVILLLSPCFISYPLISSLVFLLSRSPPPPLQSGHFEKYPMNRNLLKTSHFFSLWHFLLSSNPLLFFSQHFALSVLVDTISTRHKTSRCDSWYPWGVYVLVKLKVYSIWVRLSRPLANSIGIGQTEVVASKLPLLLMTPELFLWHFLALFFLIREQTKTAKTKKQRGV